MRENDKLSSLKAALAWHRGLKRTSITVAIVALLPLFGGFRYPHVVNVLIVSISTTCLVLVLLLVLLREVDQLTLLFPNDHRSRQR
jgi:hypothetical protein